MTKDDSQPLRVISRTVGRSRVLVIHGDITKQRVDAIVNAANTALSGGGGVDGAIHRAGGPEIMAEYRRIGDCAAGDAVRTGAGRLAVQHVIHTVGPIWNGGTSGEAIIVKPPINACSTSLRRTHHCVPLNQHRDLRLSEGQGCTYRGEHGHATH